MFISVVSDGCLGMPICESHRAQCSAKALRNEGVHIEQTRIIIESSAMQILNIGSLMAMLSDSFV